MRVDLTDPLGTKRLLRGAHVHKSQFSEAKSQHMFLSLRRTCRITWGRRAAAAIKCMRLLARRKSNSMPSDSLRRCWRLPRGLHP